MFIFLDKSIDINQRGVVNFIINKLMKEFIQGLKGVQLSSRTEERLKNFDGKIHQIYRTLQQPRPYFQKQAIFGGNSINFIEGQEELHSIPNSGIIVGRIYQLIDPSEPSTEEKNLEFRGSCFLVTSNIAICCSHQITEKKNYLIKIDGRLFKNRGQHDIKVKRIMKNTIQKIRPGQTKSQDYAFLSLEEKELTLKKTLENYLVETKITTLEGIEDSMFNFDAKIYGYFEKLPKQLDTQEEERMMWKKWAPMDIIKSQGTAQYNNKELSYTVSTEFGFSGAPIVLVDKGVYYIVGLHTRGSHFHSKNYGILFNQTFFLYLQKVINESFHENESKPSLQQVLNIVPLRSIVNYKKSLKEKLQKNPGIEFIGKALEKIIQRLQEFEDSELVVEQLRLQDIIISKESQDDFFLDFSRLPFSELVQKGSKDQSNLLRIAQVISQINKLLNINPSVPKYLTPEQCLKQQNNPNLDLKDPLLMLIQKCLDDSFNTPWAYGSKVIKILLNKIRYAKSNYQVDQYLMLSSHYPINQISEVFFLSTQQQLQQIIEMSEFKLSQDIFRKKFCLLMQYSKEKLYDNVIARTYLLKLSSFYNHLEKVIQFFIWLTEGQRNVESNSQLLQVDAASLFKQKLKCLKGLTMFSYAPKFTLLGQNFIHQSKIDKKENENLIKVTYQSILKSKKVDFSEEVINNLVKHEYIFCRTYYKYFNDLIDELNGYKHDQKLISSLKSLQPHQWQKKRQQLLCKQPQPLKKKIFGTQPFDINRTKIFQDIFIDYEHTNFNKHTYDIANMTSEQEKKYQNILNILVQIRDKNGKSRGTGFFLDKDTVCTARHIFEGKYQNFQLVNEKLQISCKILQILTSFDETNVICSDIVFLKVRVRIYNDIGKNLEKKPYFSKNIKMLDYDIQNEKEFKEKSYFGLLIGLRSTGSLEGLICPTKSYGQIQMQRSFHQLIGQPHLSGSPIFLRVAKQHNGKEEVEYQYAIIGVYSGKESGSNNLSAMQRFKSKSFKMQGSFLESIEFPRLSKCIYQIKDQLQQCIVKIYSSFDHFLLNVMGQVLRLNSLSIYLNKLSINNIIFADNLPNDLVFSRLPIKVHLQCGKYSQEMFQMKKLELETKNKSAFAGFITDLLADKTHAIFNKSDFVRQSVLVDQLDMLNSSTSLTQYFTTCLQGYYYFDKENCLLKRLQASKQEIYPYRPQALSEQSKFDMLYNRMPAEHLARINLGYSLLKNSIYQIDRIMVDNRGAILDILVFHDRQVMQKYSKQKLDDSKFYFLANKFIQEAMKAAIFQYQNKVILNQPCQAKAFTDFYEKFMAYLKQLTSLSNLNVSIKSDFTAQHRRKADTYFYESKRWNLLSQILKLYESFQV